MPTITRRAPIALLSKGLKRASLVFIAAILATSGIPVSSAFAAPGDITFSGYLGKEPGERLIGASGIAVAPNGTIYISDTLNNRINIYSADGSLISRFGEYGTGEAQFSDPKDLLFDASGNLYVNDFTNYRIQKFDASGVFLMEITIADGGGAGPSQASSMTLDTNNNLYIADSTANLAHKYNSDGTFNSFFAQTINEPDEYDYTVGIAVDTNGDIYVSHALNDRIEKYDTSGTFISEFPIPTSAEYYATFPATIAFNQAGDLLVIRSTRIDKFTTGGVQLPSMGDDTYRFGEGGFAGNTAIDVDANGNIFVLDTTGRIQKFNASEEFQMQFGENGYGDSEFIRPEDIVKDSSGNTYVLDTTTNMIQKFNTSGELILKFGGQGVNPEEIRIPRGIAVDADQNVYVADDTDQNGTAVYVKKFSPTGTYVSQFLLQIAEDAEYVSVSNMAIDPGGALYFVDEDNSIIQKYTVDGELIAQFGTVYGSSIDGEFLYPKGIAFDTLGNMYVTDVAADETTYRVQKFDANNQYVSKFDLLQENGDPYYATHITIDEAGTLYVVDYNSDHINLYSLDGTFLSSIDNANSEDRPFAQIKGILAHNGTLYVSDTNNARVVRFAIEQPPVVTPPDEETPEVPTPEAPTVPAPDVPEQNNKPPVQTPSPAAFMYTPQIVSVATDQQNTGSADNVTPNTSPAPTTDTSQVDVVDEDPTNENQPSVTPYVIASVAGVVGLGGGIALYQLLRRR